ncbi:nucleoside deaminase [Polaromonas sp.]|uniref:nucleoside deaminase n=1 Tax=Polaromonas sp. TaxID=1869339 RepID=UPI00286D1237|nr:nucleoside deaminase [Polaromonas sp.]
MSEAALTDQYFMDQVLEHCEVALYRGDCPVAALVVCDGEVVGVGSNRVATRHDATAHAETEAIRDACAQLRTSRLEGCTLYSAMEPCPMCCWALKEAGIARLVLGARHAGMHRTDYGDYAVENLLGMTRASLDITAGVRGAECEAMRRRWSRWTEPGPPVNPEPKSTHSFSRSPDQPTSQEHLHD